MTGGIQKAQEVSFHSLLLYVQGKTAWLLQEILTVLQKVTHCVTTGQQFLLEIHPSKQVLGTKAGFSARAAGVF